LPLDLLHGNPSPILQRNMADNQKRSRKRLGGNKPPKNFQIYLDENLCNCQAILDVLSHHGVKTHRHLAYFESGTQDQEWLQFVGAKKLVLLTSDKSFVTTQLKKNAS
jgi:hypothetical protein